MKRILFRTLSCLLLFVLLSSLICSNFLRVNATDTSVSNENTNTTEEDKDKEQDGLVGKIISAFTAPLNSLGDFIVNGVVGGFLNALKSVFIPDDGYFKSYFDDLNSFFSDKFGFLYYPFELILNVFDRFNSIDEYDTNKEPVELYINSPRLKREGNIYTYDYSGNFASFQRVFDCDLKKGQTLNISLTLYSRTDDMIPGFQFFLNDVFDRNFSFPSNNSSLDLNKEYNISYTASNDCHIGYDVSVWKGNQFKFIAKVIDPVAGAGSFTYPDIPEPFSKEILIKSGTINLNDVFNISEFKQVYDYYLIFVDFIIAFLLIRLAIKKYDEVVR